MTSRKLHYFTKILKITASGVHSVLHTKYPDLNPDSGTVGVLSQSSNTRLMKTFNMKDGNVYIKHIIARHDGEARLVGDFDWAPLTFPASGGTVKSACFWHYQFCTEQETRTYLYHRGQERWWQDDLSNAEIDWIMQKENNETELLKRDSDPASGGPADWYIRWGNFITLADVFYKDMDIVSCFDAYKLYLTLPNWCYKRQHSISHSAHTTMRRNAKSLQYVEEGRWGLPTSR